MTGLRQSRVVIIGAGMSGILTAIKLAESGYDGREVLILDPTDIPVAHGQSLVTAQALRVLDWWDAERTPTGSA